MAGAGEQGDLKSGCKGEDLKTATAVGQHDPYNNTVLQPVDVDNPLD